MPSRSRSGVDRVVGQISPVASVDTPRGAQSEALRYVEGLTVIAQMHGPMNTKYAKRQSHCERVMTSLY